MPDRSRAEQPVDVETAESKDEDVDCEIDEDRDHRRASCQERRHGVRGPQYAVDGPGLAAYLGREPTRQDTECKEWDEHRRSVLGWKVGQAHLLGGETQACDQAAQDRDRERIFVALRRRIRNSNEDLGGRLLVMPAGFDGGEFGRLKIMDVVAVEMPEEELHRQEYCCKVQTHG